MKTIVEGWFSFFYSKKIEKQFGTHKIKVGLIHVIINLNKKYSNLIKTNHDTLSFIIRQSFTGAVKARKTGLWSPMHADLPIVSYLTSAIDFCNKHLNKFKLVIVTCYFNTHQIPAMSSRQTPTSRIEYDRTTTDT